MFGQSYIVKKATEGGLMDLGMSKELAKNISLSVGGIVAFKTLDFVGFQEMVAEGFIEEITEVSEESVTKINPDFHTEKIRFGSSELTTGDMTHFDRYGNGYTSTTDYVNGTNAYTPKT